MLNALLHLLLTAGALLLIATVIPGIHVGNWGVALVAALVFGLVNLLLKPILSILTLPVTFLSFGLFSFVLNAILFGLTAWLVPGFEVHGFFAALFGSLALGFLMSIIGGFFAPKTQQYGV
jgi:putative membrane protein